LAHMKQFLCDYHSQTPILAAMQLHQELHGESIESVVVHTYGFCTQ
jgi:2-methylcitrate dehydratase PrpD